MITADMLGAWLSMLEKIEAGIDDCQKAEAIDADAAALDLAETIADFRKALQCARLDALRQEISTMERPESDGQARKRSLLERDAIRLEMASEISEFVFRLPDAAGDRDLVKIVAMAIREEYCV